MVMLSICWSTKALLRFDLEDIRRQQIVLIQYFFSQGSLWTVAQGAQENSKHRPGRAEREKKNSARQEGSK